MILPVFKKKLCCNFLLFFSRWFEKTGINYQFQFSLIDTEVLNFNDALMKIFIHNLTLNLLGGLKSWIMSK